MATSVAAALRLSGGRNAGTPFDTASTPVMAVQPFENAVRSANVVSRPVAEAAVRELVRRNDGAGEIPPGAGTQHGEDA